MQGKRINDYFKALFLPRIGVMEQHAPRPMTVPGWYAKTPPGAADGRLPVVSIVTPSFNQAEFVGRTVRSVFDQHYPQVEYILQDGRSQDGTHEALAPYQSRMTHFESRPDQGQAHAINLGFQHATGEIMAYLNSDDILLPGALKYVAGYFALHPDVDVVYSHRLIINSADQEVGRWILPPHDDRIIQWADYVPQETLFWRRRLWDRTGGRMDESYHFALDWDLILRFLSAGGRFKRLPRFLAAFRVHPRQKTSLHMDQSGRREINRLRRQIHGREIGLDELRQNIYPYLVQSILYHRLYRMGLLRY